MLLVASCTIMPETKNLREPHKSTEIMLNNDYIYKPSRGVYIVSLLNGKYSSFKENEYGTLYLGPSNCIVWTNESNSKLSVSHSGGIFVPKSINQPWQTFIIAGTRRSSRGSPNNERTPDNSKELVSSAVGPVIANLGEVFAQDISLVHEIDAQFREIANVK